MSCHVIWSYTCTCRIDVWLFRTGKATCSKMVIHTWYSFEVKMYYVLKTDTCTLYIHVQI